MMTKVTMVVFVSQKLQIQVQFQLTDDEIIALCKTNIYK